MRCRLPAGEFLRTEYMTATPNLDCGPGLRPTFISLKGQEFLTTLLEPGVEIDIGLDSQEQISKRRVVASVCGSDMSNCNVVVGVSKDELDQIRRSSSTKQTIYLLGGR